MPTVQHRNQGGFTLIEMLIVLMIIAALFALGTVNLGRPQTDTSVSTTLDSLVNDLRSQQLLAMVGDTAGQASQQPHGIHFASHAYSLFADTTFSAGNVTNFVVDTPDNLTISTSLSNQQVVFEAGDGDVVNFSATKNTISIASGEVIKTIIIGRHGALSLQ